MKDRTGPAFKVPQCKLSGQERQLTRTPEDKEFGKLVGLPNTNSPALSASA